MLKSPVSSKACRRRALELSPYLLLELVMPGGTLAAGLLWLFRHRSARRRATP